MLEYGYTETSGKYNPSAAREGDQNIQSRSPRVAPVDYFGSHKLICILAFFIVSKTSKDDLEKKRSKKLGIEEYSVGFLCFPLCNGQMVCTSHPLYDVNKTYMAVLLCSLYALHHVSIKPTMERKTNSSSSRTSHTLILGSMQPKKMKHLASQIQMKFE